MTPKTPKTPAEAAFDAASAMVAEALASAPIIEAEIDDVSAIPEILAVELDRLASLTDDELAMEYDGNHALETDALEVDPLRYPLPTQAHLDAYAAEYGKPQAEPNPTRSTEPLRKRKRPSFWDESPF
jgi:hypothetical protein